MTEKWRKELSDEMFRELEEEGDSVIIVLKGETVDNLNMEFKYKMNKETLKISEISSVSPY
jgi:ATP sulfurylase